MYNILTILQCAHHANTFDFNHTILVAGDKIGILSITAIYHDQLFHHNYNLCIDELYKESLRWAYEENVELPLKEIESGVKKARVKLDLDTVVKSFYFWKVFTKYENLPLPPMLRILPIHHSYWNVTKHGSKVKTAYT